MFNVPYFIFYFKVLFKYIPKFGVFCFLGNITFFEIDCQARRLMIGSKVRCTDVVFISNTVDTAAQLESAREPMTIQISVLTKHAMGNIYITDLTELTRKTLAEVKIVYTEFHYDRQVKSQFDR